MPNTTRSASVTGTTVLSQSSEAPSSPVVGGNGILVRERTDLLKKVRFGDRVGGRTTGRCVAGTQHIEVVSVRPLEGSVHRGDQRQHARAGGERGQRALRCGRRFQDEVARLRRSFQVGRRRDPRLLCGDARHGPQDDEIGFLDADCQRRRFGCAGKRRGGPNKNSGSQDESRCHERRGDNREVRREPPQTGRSFLRS